MNETLTLRDMKINESAIVDTVGGTGSLRQHLLDMGIIPGAKVRMIRPAPMGDPLEFRIHDYELTLRAEDAGRITVKPAKDTDNAERFISAFHEVTVIEHPGLGEEGQYLHSLLLETRTQGKLLSLTSSQEQAEG